MIAFYLKDPSHHTVKIIHQLPEFEKTSGGRLIGQGDLSLNGIVNHPHSMPYLNASWIMTPIMFSEVVISVSDFLKKPGPTFQEVLPVENLLDLKKTLNKLVVIDDCHEASSLCIPSVPVQLKKTIEEQKTIIEDFPLGK